MNATLKIGNQIETRPADGPLVLLFALGLFFSASDASAEDLLSKPQWLPELTLGLSESYDDNLLGVSGLGLKPQASWITKVSPRIGFDFVPLLSSNASVQTLTLYYAPDIATFHEAPSENYTAHKFGGAARGSSGDFSYLFDNSFLYNDGSRVAPTYALNQLSGAGANQFDKYRNQFANTPARERRNQFQDQEESALQYDAGKFFVRASTSLLDYNLNTYQHNSSKAPYLGYQNYVDRYDVNGGPGLGYRITTNLAFTAAYRYGSQYQQQFPANISSDFHYASSTYQRALFGLEGQPWRWVDVKLDGGPDFRQYNPDAPVYDHHPAKYYGEAMVTLQIAPEQKLSFNYKQWNWVASTGYVPEFDSYYALNYHWSASKKLGFDLGGKIQEADYTAGNDTLGTAPSVRADRVYVLSPSVTYAFDRHLSATLTYTYNAGNNVLLTIPASSHPGYKNFIDQQGFLGLVYKF